MVPASLILLLLALSTIYPFVFVFLTSIKDPLDYAENPLGPPKVATGQYIRQAWTEGQIGHYAQNSLVVAGGSVALIVIIACLAGYALVHLEFPLRRFAPLGIVCLMMLPPAVLMVPLFKTVQQLGLLDSYRGLILVYASLHLPFSIYLMASHFRRIPSELFRAAEVDGAGTFRRFTTIAVPLARPALATLATLNFLWVWNELLFALLIIQDGSKRTLMVGLALLQGEFSTPVPLLAAGLLLSLGPPLAAFIFFQRYLATGLTAGAVK